MLPNGNYAPDAPSWGQSQVPNAGGDLQGVIMQIARLFAQLVPAMMGAPGPAAQAARYAAYGGLADIAGGPMGPKAAGRTMMGLGIMGGMQDVTGGGGAQTGGFGMGIGAADAMMAGLGGGVGAGSGQMRPGEFGGMMGMAGQGGFFRGISDIRDARRRMQDLVRTVTELHHELNLTVETVMQDLNGMRQMGGFTNVNRAAGAFRATATTATMAGMSVDQALQQFIAPQAQQLRVAARIPMQAAYETARIGLQTVGGAARAGFITEDALYNATGMGGEQGAMALTGQIQSAAMRQSADPKMNYMMAAALDPKTGQINQNQTQQIMSGQMGMNDIMQLANRNVGAIGGQAAWQQMQPQIRGQFMQQTGGMGMLALANTAAMAAAPNDPNLQQAYFQRLSGAQDPMQAQAFRMAMSSWGAMQERSEVVQRHIDQQAQAGARMTERAQYADLSDIVGNNTKEFTDRVMAPLDSALANMSVRAVDLLTGYTEPAAVGAGYSASLSRGSAARFYSTIPPETGAAGSFLSTSEYLDQGTSTIAKLKAAADKAPAGQPREALQSALDEYQKRFMSGLGGSMTRTAEYWGVGGRGANAADLTMTQAQARTSMGLGEEVSEAEKQYSGTNAGRMGVLSLYGQAVAATGSAGKVQQRLLELTGQTGGKWKGNVVEMLANASEGQITSVMSSLIGMTGQEATSDQIGVLGKEAFAGIKAAQRLGMGRYSLAKMDIATGKGFGFTTAGLAQEAAYKAGETATSAVASKGLTTLFQNNPEILGQLGEYLTKGAGAKEWTGGTLGQLLSKAKIQTSIFGEAYLNTTFGTAEATVKWLQTSMVAGKMAATEAILTAGILGEEAYKHYGEIGKESRGEGGRVARTLGGARRRFAEGDMSGLTAAGEEITRLATMQDRHRFEQGLRALEPSSAQRIRDYRAAVQSGGVLTLEEAKATGAVGDDQISAALGKDLYADATSGKRLSHHKQLEISEKLQRVTSEALISVSAGKQGDPGQPTGPAAGAASSGLAQALQDAMTQVPEIKVRVVNANEMRSTTPSGSNDQIDSGTPPMSKPPGYFD